jgi:hypothetical protein
VSVQPFNTVAPLNRIVEILNALPGMDEVYIGVPKGIETTVAAYVTVGPQTITDKAGGLLQRLATYTVTLCYAVEGDSTASELAVAGVLEPLILALYAERDLDGSALEDSAIDLTLAGSAEYQTVAGQEFRRYPINVTVLQQQVL